MANQKGPTAVRSGPSSFRTYSLASAGGIGIVYESAYWWAATTMSHVSTGSSST